MKFVDFTSIIRGATRTNATTFVDADILRIANMYKDSFAQDIADTDEGIFGMPYTADLIAGQREYELPDELIKVLRVEAIADGTNQKKYISFDVSSLDFELTETRITEKFQEKYFYNFFRKSIKLFTGETIVATTGGLLLRAIIYPADFTDLTSTVDMAVRPAVNKNGFPRQFHELLARRVIIHRKENRDRPIPLTQSEKNFADDYRAAMDATRGTVDNREVIPTRPYNTGAQY